MQTTQSDELLMQADVSAKNQDWQKSFDFLNQASNLQPDHAGILTGMGTCLVQLGKSSEAIPYFQKAADLMPDSFDIYNILGIAHIFCGHIQEAEIALKKSIELKQDQPRTWKNLARLYLQQDDRLEEGIDILAALVKEDPDDIEALSMLARTYEEAHFNDSAVVLYERILTLQPDDAEAKAALKRLTHTPVQSPEGDSSRIARPEHAKKLASLKSLSTIKTAQTASTPSQTVPPSRLVNPVMSVKSAIAFYGPATDAAEARLLIPAQALANSGTKVKAAPILIPLDLTEYSTFVFANPHLSSDLVQSLETCIQAGKRTVVDLDLDFHNIPPENPNYMQAGPGNPAVLQVLERLLEKVDLLTVPSAVMAEYYHPYAQHIEVIPYCWTHSNPLWEQPAQPRNTINLGVLSNQLDQADVNRLKAPLKRLLDEKPQVLLVVYGNLDYIKIFSNVPEDQVLYLPPAALKDYPFVLSNFDILLFPCGGSTYDLSWHDLPLLEAGIRKIPWVATPIPSYQEWSSGGLLADKNEDWYKHLLQLTNDATFRHETGNAGRLKAETREVNNFMQNWEKIITGR